MGAHEDHGQDELLKIVKKNLKSQQGIVNVATTEDEDHLRHHCKQGKLYVVHF